LSVVRKMLLIKINPALAESLSIELGETLELKLNQVKDRFTIEQMVLLLEQLTKVAQEIKTSFIIQLPLEIMITRICSNVPQVAVMQRSAAGQPAATANPVIIKPAASSEVSDINVTIEQILEKWQEFLVRIKSYNHSLSFILRVCQPRNLNGQELCLAFKYKFHKDRVTDPNIKALLERVLKETYGANLTIEAAIDENLEVETAAITDGGNGAEPISDKPASPAAPADQTANNEMLDNLLKTFGGKIVG
jgi:hypothetical protein